MHLLHLQTLAGCSGEMLMFDNSLMPALSAQGVVVQLLICSIFDILDGTSDAICHQGCPVRYRPAACSSTA